MKKSTVLGIVTALLVPFLWVTPSSANAAPKSQSATVTITGSPRVGDTLYAEVDGLRAGTATKYSWTINGVVVSREASLYIDDLNYTGKIIKVTVSGKKSGYKDYKYTSPVITEGAITRINAGSISGDLLVSEGAQLTANCGTFVPALGSDNGMTQCDYQWKADGINIDGAVSDSLPLADNLIGKNISVITTLTSVNMENKTYQITTSGKLQGELVWATEPTFSGTGLVGETLNLDTYPTFSTDNVSINFQWYRGGSKIKNATSSNYVLTSSDWHKSISVQITAAKPNYMKSVTRWAVQDYVLKLITKSGRTLSGYSAWDSCDYSDYYSYNCWRHTQNSKWACAWNDEYYDDDYTLMNLSAYAPISSDRVLEWRAVLTGTVGTSGGLLITNASDEGISYLDTDGSTYYDSGTKWYSSWNSIAPTSDGLFHTSVYIGDYGGFYVKSFQIQVHYIG